MGLIVTTKVVTRANMPGKPHLIQPGNQEWVTMIKYVNATGWVLPSCIIFKGRFILRDGIKIRPYHLIGELKSVKIDGQQIR
jgi:hypothetical protein